MNPALMTFRSPACHYPPSYSLFIAILLPEYSLRLSYIDFYFFLCTFSVIHLYISFSFQFYLILITPLNVIFFITILCPKYWSRLSYFHFSSFYRFIVSVIHLYYFSLTVLSYPYYPFLFSLLPFFFLSIRHVFLISILLYSSSSSSLLSIYRFLFRYNSFS